jgi:ribonuclease P protein component
VKRQHRLRTPADFQRVRDAAPRGLPHPLLVLYQAPNDLPLARVGITVSGRVGNAIVRNRVKRRLREALRLRLSQLPSGQDLVVVARPRAAAATWTELNVALDTVLARAGGSATAAARASV